MPKRTLRLPALINRNTIRALRHRNYRIYFMGQGVSLVGTWLQQLALPWMTYELTKSAFMLGLVGFLEQIPVLLLGPLAGLFSDRFNRLKLLRITQTLAMLQAFTLASLTLSHLLTVNHIIALSLFMGTVSAFDIPVRQAFLFQMVDAREDLGNAIALNSSLVNLARMVGPAVAGILIGLVGAGWCFMLNALSFMAVLYSLFIITPRPQPAAERAGSALAHFGQGFKYTFGFAPIRDAILLLALSSICVTSFVVLMPEFVDTVLLGDSGTFGWLMAASGLGALLGAVHLAARPTVVGLGRLIPAGGVLLGISMIGFGLSDRLWLCLLLRFTGSAGMILQMAATNTIIQTVTEDRQRGRVMAFFTMAFIGMAPIGSLLGGTLSHHLGTPMTLQIAGGVMIAAAAAFALRLPHLRKQIRPIYQKLGILPLDVVPPPG
jgi:MFS family permease